MVLVAVRLARLKHLRECQERKVRGWTAVTFKTNDRRAREIESCVHAAMVTLTVPGQRGRGSKRQRACSRS